MKDIQSQTPNNPLTDSPEIFYGIFFILLGAISVLSFLRPVMNLYTIYFEITWAEFQILEIFDIINLVFGIFLLLLGFLLLYFQKFNRRLMLYGGILLLIFNLLDPSHFLMFWCLLSLIIGAPPVWMQVINENLFITYVSIWSLLSISNLILQAAGIYIAIRIILNSNPKKGLTTYVFFYCWVLALSGILLSLQSLIIQTITGSWTTIAVAPYIFNFITWVFMVIAGVSGLFFIASWRKNRSQGQMIKFGQISLISFSVMYSLVSFSDIAMKEMTSLLFSTILSIVIIIFAMKIPYYLKDKKEG